MARGNRGNRIKKRLLAVKEDPRLVQIAQTASSGNDAVRKALKMGFSPWKARGCRDLYRELKTGRENDFPTHSRPGRAGIRHRRKRCFCFLIIRTVTGT